ncbi:MAG: hypothetical protein ACREDF_11035, partial [Thermoplasmata archaeon]
MVVRWSRPTKDLVATGSVETKPERGTTFTYPARGVLWRRGHPTDVELGALAKYPFLREASAYIRAEQGSLEEILTEPAYARVRAIGK